MAIKRLFPLTPNAAPAVESRSSDMPADPLRRPARSRPAKGAAPVDRYQEVTDRIIEAIEAGTVPWRRRWDEHLQWPQNGTTKKSYHGVNVMNLLMEERQDPRWCSFNQAKEKGWKVRRGEQGTKVYFYKPLRRETNEVDPATGLPDVKMIPLLKAYTIFNFSQIEGAPELEWNDSRPNACL